MKIIRLVHPHSLNKAELEPTVIALGFFDGVHLGHQEVIGTAKKKADELGYQSAVMTLDPHPSVAFSKRKKDAKYITPIQKKIKCMEALGIDVLYIVEVNENFAALQPQDFVHQYLVGLHVKHVVTGFDYSYGKSRQGTTKTLLLHGKGEFALTTIGEMTRDGEKISSSKIRELLATGKVDEIEGILGRVYTVEGVVIHGDERGRTIGFPTANIDVDKEQLLPICGVYGVRIKVKGTWYEGICNVGDNPTFTDEKQLKVEVYIFDFQQFIYGEHVEIEWHFFIREVKKFESVEQLIEQLTLNSETAKQYFAKV